ncbi:MAG: M20/M25/M40 family metallo-hydrolase [Cyanobacteria bacterium P01_D01_bin.156]
MNQAITELADIGALPEGGVQRLAFSNEDLEARAVIRHRMIAAGMNVSVDAAGNLISHYPGQYSDAPALTTGSHIDSVNSEMSQPPVNFHIHHTIATVCSHLGLDTHFLPSRASHDAQNIARIADMGMIFVPSQSGLSHAADEYTSPEHCAQGANVLLHTLIQLDQHYRCRLDQRLQDYQLQI